MSPTATTSEQHVSSYQIEVDGAEIDSKLMDAIGEIKIVDSLMLPDTCDLTVFINSYEHDKAIQEVEALPFEVGKELTLKVGAIDDPEPMTVLFKGDVVAIDVDFGHGGISVGVRAYDHSHVLHRSRHIRVFQNKTSSDAVKQVLSEAGFSPQVDASGDPHEWLQQDNETDWEFIWRLARLIDFWLLIDGTTAKFVKAGSGDGSVALEYPETLHAFHPRITGVQQVEKVTVSANDPKTKQAINGEASSPSQIAEVGTTRASVRDALEGGSLHISNESVFGDGEAKDLAQATLDRVANAYIEATGHVQGNPKIKSGVKLEVSGVGSKLNGTYMAGEVKHTVQGGGSFETHFTTATATPTTLAALAGGGGGRARFGDRLVIGLVTNNNDPDKLGRVKVSFPALDDSLESGWLRVVNFSAGKQRGTMMTPQKDEEVIVGFENGDTRRGYVLGSLFNGKDTPGDDLVQDNDGSFGLLSDKKILATSLDEMKLTSTKKMTVKVDDEQEITVQKDRNETVQGNMNDKVGGSWKSEATGSASLKATGSYTIESNASITIKAPSITVEGQASLELKAPTVTINGSGMVNISGGIINLG